MQNSGTIRYGQIGIEIDTDPPCRDAPMLTLLHVPNWYVVFGAAFGMTSGYEYSFSTASFIRSAPPAPQP